MRSILYYLNSKLTVAEIKNAILNKLGSTYCRFSNNE